MGKHIYIILSLLLITLLSSCSEIGTKFNYLNRLKESIAEKYDPEKVEINIKNDSELTVSLIDSKFDAYTPAEKEQIAREIGKLAQELREDGETLKAGIVNFREDNNYGAATSSNTVNYPMYE